MFDYIRKHQKLLDGDRIIAPLIYHLCLLFFHMKEYWAAFDDVLFKVNKQKDTFTNIRNGKSTIYGNICTDLEIECIYK